MSPISPVSAVHDREARDYITSPGFKARGRALDSPPAKLFDNARSREFVARMIFWGLGANEPLSMVNRRAPDHRPELDLCAWPGSRVRRPDHNRHKQFGHTRLAGAARGRRIRRERLRQ